MLLSSVSFLYVFFKQDIDFLFFIFWEDGFEELASSPRAQAPQLQVHSDVFCVLARAGLYLVLALWGKEKEGMCEWLGGVSQKVPLVLQEGEHSASAGQGGDCETTAAGSPRKISC